jgi:hypothetical protein
MFNGATLRWKTCPGDMAMSDELAIRSEVSVPKLSESDVLDAFLSGRNANTLEA